MSLVPDGDLNLPVPPPEGYSVRKANSDDAEVIYRLIDTAYGGQYLRIAGTAVGEENAKSDALEEIRSDFSCLSYTNTVIALHGDTPVGFIATFNPNMLIQYGLDTVPPGFHIDRELIKSAVDKYNAPFYISFLAIEPDHRRSRITNALVRLVKVWHRGSIFRASLLVHAENPAKALYRRHGFRNTGERGGDGADELELWTREPGAGSSSEEAECVLF